MRSITSLIFLYLIINSISVAECTLSKDNKKKEGNSVKPVKKKLSGEQTSSVEDRGLVVKSLKWKSIVENSDGYFSSASISNLTTLAYVTPWNNRGYDIAKWQAGRFSLISPVWLQLKTHQHSSENKGGYMISGQFDIDHNWMRDVKEAAKKQGSKVKFVPRLIFEGWSLANFQRLVDEKETRAVLSQRIIDVLEAQSLDGVVLELWSQFPHQKLFKSMPPVIADVCDVIRRAGYLVVLVIPPAVYDRNIAGMFQAHHFKFLAPHVDYFSLMTYDFSNFQNPGPNSPIWWVEKCVESISPNADDPDRKKILLGMNMYGLEHKISGGRHILGRDYIEILSSFRPDFKYDDNTAEHYCEYKSKDGKVKVYYPSLFSIKQRINLAERLGTGLSLWEIGQGLDYFYDLF